MGRLLAITVLVLALGAAPAVAAPGILGAGEDPGVAVDSAGTAHVAWFNQGALEYCQVPRGKRKCAARSSFPLAAPGISAVQVLAPRPGTVVIVAPLLNEPAQMLVSADNGATFAPRAIGQLSNVAASVFGPGDTVALMSGAAAFARYGTDGVGPADWAVTFGDSLEALTNTMAPYGAGYAVFFAGSGQTRSALFGGIGDPNLPQSWVEGPRLGAKRIAPAAVGGPSGTFVAYTDRRGRKSLRVRRLRTSARFGAAKRLSGDDPTVIDAAQGPGGDMIVLWRMVSDEVRFVRSKQGRRWTRPRRLFRGHDPEFLRPVLGARGGWMVWGSGGTGSVVRIAALPRAPRR